MSNVIKGKMPKGRPRQRCLDNIVKSDPRKIYIFNIIFYILCLQLTQAKNYYKNKLLKTVLL